ncbi:MAG TPA: RIO1 family regulatory kinase/ATPase [Candidatus Paceibacterota bacterium]|nr:RIO1 family regulatory kinase/ATPase [Candidatus Paceibacterota bacterium]
MGGFEKHTPRKIDRRDDYLDTSYSTLLRKLPQELAERHIDYIEKKQMSETEAYTYLTEIIRERKKAITESHLSDNELIAHCSNPKEEIFDRLEDEIFKSPNIGYGTTAQIKRLDISIHNTHLPLAVKYIITPNSRTLSASAEHAMLQEVERIEHIEEIEKDSNLTYIKVPHPYFHHKTESLQCFGMELVRGVNFQEIIDGNLDEDRKELFKNSLRSLPTEQVIAEIRIFFERMHSYCLHGDIKPRNIMLNEEGHIYLIDFGQSILKTSISEEAIDQFENLKEDEVHNTISAFRIIYRKLTT